MRKISTVEAQIVKATGQLGMAKDRRKASGNRIQSMAEIRLTAKISRLQGELQSAKIASNAIKSS